MRNIDNDDDQKDDDDDEDDENTSRGMPWKRRKKNILHEVLKSHLKERGKRAKTSNVRLQNHPAKSIMCVCVCYAIHSNAYTIPHHNSSCVSHHLTEQYANHLDERQWGNAAPSPLYTAGTTLQRVLAEQTKRKDSIPLTINSGQVFASFTQYPHGTRPE